MTQEKARKSKELQEKLESYEHIQTVIECVDNVEIEVYCPIGSRDSEMFVVTDEIADKFLDIIESEINRLQKEFDAL